MVVFAVCRYRYFCVTGLNFLDLKVYFYVNQTSVLLNVSFLICIISYMPFHLEAVQKVTSEKAKKKQH
jgi:hypothetical protein